jgi:hypothetical protein
MSRKEPTLTAKLAACIRELLGIPYEHAKLMTDDQMISLIQFDHIHHHALNKHEPWVDEHWNLDPLTIMIHRVKTRTIDVPQIAKTKRLTREHEEFQRLMLTPRAERPVKKSRWGSRPFNQRRTK